MTIERVPDDAVDAVQVLGGPPGRFEGRALGLDGLARRVLEAFVSVDRDTAVYLVEGARQRRSRGTDAGAFAFSEVSGEDGVVIEVGAGRVVLVSEDAFARLIDRLEQALGPSSAADEEV